MKKLLILLNDLSSDLVSKIEKKQIAINSSKEIPFINKNIKGVSDEEASEILINSKKYRKSAKEFSEDSSKIVVSKKVFLNFLLLFKGVNLFLFKNLSLEKKAHVRIKKSWQKVFSKATESSDKTILKILFIAFLIFTASLIVLLFLLKKNESLRYICWLIFFAALVCLCFYFYEFIRIKTVLKSREIVDELFKVHNLFYYGYDVDRYDQLGSSSLPLEVIFLPDSLPVQSDDFINKFISLKVDREASVGYLIHKEGASLKLVEKYLEIHYLCTFISVIVLEDIIIFPSDSIEKMGSVEIDEIKIRNFFEEQGVKLFL